MKVVGRKATLLSDPRPTIEKLLDVLHLLLQPIDRTLDFHNVPGDLSVVSFARDCVGLPQHFLRDEIELAAGVLAAGAGLLERFQVMREAGDFFGDVCPLGEDGDFLE